MIKDDDNINKAIDLLEQQNKLLEGRLTVKKIYAEAIEKKWHETKKENRELKDEIKTLKKIIKEGNKEHENRIIKETYNDIIRAIITEIRYNEVINFMTYLQSQNDEGSRTLWNSKHTG